MALAGEIAGAMVFNGSLKCVPLVVVSRLFIIIFFIVVYIFLINFLTAAMKLAVRFSSVIVVRRSEGCRGGEPFSFFLFLISFANV